MKIINKNNKISILIINKNSLNKETINEDIKQLIFKLKRTYKQEISGIYKAHIYINKFGIIIDLIKEEDIDLFKDILDLKIILHEKEETFLTFEDYFLLKNKKVYFLNNKYYINIDELNYKEFLNICEFSNIIYGEELKTIKNYIKKITEINFQ